MMVYFYSISLSTTDNVAYMTNLKTSVEEETDVTSSTRCGEVYERVDSSVYEDVP